MCIKFVHEWRDLQFKFIAFLFNLRVFAKNVLKGSGQKYIFLFRFVEDI